MEEADVRFRCLGTLFAMACGLCTGITVLLTIGVIIYSELVAFDVWAWAWIGVIGVFALSSIIACGCCCCVNSIVCWELVEDRKVTP